MRRLLVLASLTGTVFAQPDFLQTVWPVMEKARCAQCHNDNGVASTTKLSFPREGADPDEIRAFSLRLRQFVNAADPEQSLLFRKPTNRIPHGGNERVKQGSPDEQALLAWVKYLASLKEDAVPTAKKNLGPSRPVLRRLTHSQYNHTMRDLLKEETRPADAFPKEDFVHGFTNQAEGQSVPPLLAEAYGRAAERLARNAFRGGDGRGLIGCAPSAACRVEFIKKFGRRAYRRPLTPVEVAKFEKMFAKEKDFLSGAQMVVETMLQSPHFLFHLEPGGYAIASRLSYFLWDTMPDEELFEAAGKGALNSSTGIEKQVKRMLGDERAQSALDEFLAQWLRYDRLRSAIRDRRLYPEFNLELVNAMTDETTKLFRSLVWENRNFMEFFTSEISNPSPELARVYGDSAGPKSPRSGVLGEAYFLSVTSKPVDTSPTERGIFVREHFLCQQVPPPPPGVDATLPSVTDEKPLSTKDRLAVHLKNPSCAGCHVLMDQIGFGLEKFDAIGRYREQELVKIFPIFDEIKTKRKTKPTEYKLPIEGKGNVRGIKNSEFTSPRELGTVLAKEPACQRCVVKQLFRYAVGRTEEAEDQPVIDAALERFRGSQFKFQELIIAVATSETFRGGL